MARKKKTARRAKAQTYDREFRLPMPAIVRENPLDSMGLALAVFAAGAIIVNALLMQGVQTVSAGKDAPAASGAAAIEGTPVSAITVRPEAPSMLVLEVQSELQRRGLYDGPADGIFGPKTEAAIASFETRMGLKPTGRPNPQVLTALRTGDAPTPASRVAAIQRALDRQGFGPVKADGVAGEATRAAIRRFEASRGLPQRGEITPEFLAELSRVSGADFD